MICGQRQRSAKYSPSPNGCGTKPRVAEPAGGRQSALTAAKTFSPWPAPRTLARPSQLCFFVDEEGRALDLYVGPTLVHLFGSHAIVLAQRPVFIAGQQNLQRILVPKLDVIPYDFSRGAADDGACAFEFRDRLCESDLLFVATQSVVLRVKIEHHLLALEIVEL